HTILPDTVLEPLLPLQGRVEQWARVGERSGMVIPAMVHSKRWTDRFMVLSMALAGVPVLTVWWSLYAMGWLPGIFVWLFSIPAFIAWVVLISRIHRRLLLATPHLAVNLPQETAGELASAALALNLDALEAAMAQESLSREAIWGRVARIVAEWLKVAPECVEEGTEIGETMRA
ncbi:MAG TPA: hypothetical protein VHA37_03820, partial [Candidatus Saccharimonadales bacterium]|nr:hypothetical protein [Candidatus Saccharimonadales bacterium]